MPTNKLRQLPLRELTADDCRRLLSHNHGGYEYSAEVMEARRKYYHHIWSESTGVPSGYTSEQAAEFVHIDAAARVTQQRVKKP